MFVPIARELKRIRQENTNGTVSEKFQSRQIRYAANVFRSLLKTIECKSGTTPSRSLLKLLDTIGDYFSNQCLGETFHPEPKLSFTAPSNMDQNLTQTLARALNAGAIIYIPDAKADPLLNSMEGKRFRLNYLLAAYYELPILLGAEAPLITILHSESGETENLCLFNQEEAK